MSLKSIQEYDRKTAQRLINFKLPYYWKKIGLYGFAVLFLGLLATKFFESDLEVLKEILKKASLVFLFVIVISRERIEDERVQNMRSQSFSFSFLAAVLYTILQPLVNYLVFAIVKPEKAEVVDLGDFQILWFMLVVYLMFFYVLKKRG